MTPPADQYPEGAGAPRRRDVLRVGVVGLGTIWQVVQGAFARNVGFEAVVLCDPDPARRAQASAAFPSAHIVATLDELLAEPDLDWVEVLVPSPLHCEIACRILDAGIAVQLQKPMASTLAEADSIRAAAQRSGVACRVTEDYCWIDSLMALRDVVRSGRIGDPVAIHAKIVATGPGAWDADDQAWQWLMPNTLAGLGVMTYDHGWHQFAVACWLFGAASRVSAWVGRTPVGGPFVIDAPTTVMWDHHSGVRGVLDIAFAPETYWASRYYGGDERFEVTGTRGFARVNWVTAHGPKQPVLEVYVDGELEQRHDLDGDWARGLQRSTAAFADVVRGGAPIAFDAAQGRDVLALVLGAIESSTRSGAAVELDAPVGQWSLA